MTEPGTADAYLAERDAAAELSASSTSTTQPTHVPYTRDDLNDTYPFARRHLTVNHPRPYFAHLDDDIAAWSGARDAARKDWHTLMPEILTYIGHTQAGFARAIGTSQPTVNRWMHGTAWPNNRLHANIRRLVFAVRPRDHLFAIRVSEALASLRAVAQPPDPDIHRRPYHAALEREFIRAATDAGYTPATARHVLNAGADNARYQHFDRIARRRLEYLGMVARARATATQAADAARDVSPRIRAAMDVAVGAPRSTWNTHPGPTDRLISQLHDATRVVDVATSLLTESPKPVPIATRVRARALDSLAPLFTAIGLDDPVPSQSPPRARIAAVVKESERALRDAMGHVEKEAKEHTMEKKDG